MIFCNCGCGVPTPLYKSTNLSRGIVKGTPSRFLTGHHRPKKPIDKRYEINPATGCWEWLLAKDRKGYGRENDRNAPSDLAHINSYVRHKGAIPEGMELDHLCRNTGCINPDHLEPVSDAVNSRRRPATLLTEKAVQEVKRRYAAGERLKDMAGEFGVHRSTLSNAMTGYSWADVV
jgi:hypothetical protein